MNHFTQLKKYTLDNGTRVLILPEEGHRLATAQVWYEVGARFESPDIFGMSHFLEHLFFKGTKEMGPGEIDRRLNAIGAMNNAATSKDYTFYYVFGTSDVLEEMYDIQARMLLNPAFDEEEINKERDVVIAEIHRANDNPSHLFYYQMMEQAFSEHPYAHPVLGFEDIIRNVPKEKIVDYYKSHYHAGSATVLIAGNVKEKDALKMVEATYGKLPQSSWTAQAHQPVHARPGRKLSYARTHRNYSSLGFIGPSSRNLRDTLALDLLGTILTDQRSSRWIRELKEQKDLVESLSFGCYSATEQSLISIYAMVKDNRFTAYHEAIAEALERLRKYYVSREELEEARNQTLHQSAHRLQKLTGRAQQLGFYATMGQLEYCTRHEDLIRSISQEDMIRVIEKYLSTDPMISQMLPEGEKEESQEATPVVESPRHSLKTEVETLDEVTSVYTFKSGLKFIYQKQPAHQLATARLAAGSTAELATRFPAGAGLMVQKLLSRGTSSLNLEQISQTMDRLGARYTTVPQSAQTARESYSSRLDCPESTFWDAFRVFSSFFTDPAFPEEEFRKMRESSISDIKSLPDSLSSYCLYNLMQNFFQGHPFAIPALGTQTSLNELSLKDLRDFHSLAYAAPNLILAIGGPWEPQEALEKVQELFHRHLGSIEYRITDHRVPMSFVPPLLGKKAIVKNPKEQAYLMPAWPTGPAGTRESSAGQVLNEMLGGGMSSRFFRNMRDEKSYGYEIGSSLAQWNGMGMLFCYLGTDPRRVEDASMDFKAEIRDLLENQPLEEEVDKARRLISSRHAMSLETPSDRVGWLLRLYTSSLPYSWLTEYESRIQSITPQDVQDFAQKYLSIDPFEQRIVP